MYCMECGGEIPENGQYCPVCGKDAPRRVATAPLPPAGPPPGMPPYRYPVYPAQGYPPYPGYPAPYGYPPQPGYQPSYASSQAPSYVVVPMASPLPGKPPLRQRIRERWEVYAAQAKENRLETGLSFAAAGAVVLGVAAMLLSSL